MFICFFEVVVTSVFVFEVRVGGGDVTYEEYFNAFIDLKGRDIGKTKEVSVRCRKFAAHLWLADGYPLSLPDQVSFLS
jgi:hypothetical protein